MTKKDYRLIAAAMNRTKPDSDNIRATEQWEKDCKSLACTLSYENSRFHKFTFLSACGVDSIESILGGAQHHG